MIPDPEWVGMPGGVGSLNLSERRGPTKDGEGGVWM